MKQRLDIPRRCRPAQHLAVVTELCAHPSALACELLAERNLVERAEAAHGEQHAAQVRIDHRSVGQQRFAPRALRSKQHFVGLEVGGLEQHACAIGERPLADVGTFERTFAQHAARSRQHRHERRIRRGVHIGGERCMPGIVEHCEHRLLRGHLDVSLQWACHEDDAILVRERTARQRIHLCQGDGGQQLARQRLSVHDAKDRSAGQCRANVLTGKRRRIRLVTLGKRLLQAAQVLGAHAIQLGLREPETRYAFRLGEQGLRCALEATLLHTGKQLVDVARAHELTASGAREGECGVGLLGKFVEPGVHHAIVQRRDVVAAQVGHSARAVALLEPHQCDRRAGILLVGLDGDERFVVRGHGGIGARPAVRRHGECPEPLANVRLHCRDVKVAHGNDRHEIRTIPVVVELLGELRVEMFEVLDGADGQPRGVLRAAQHHGKLPILHPRLSAEPRTPLLDHHAALLLLQHVVERQCVCPVFHDVQPLGQQSRRVGGNLEHVDGLVERRGRVEVRAKSHARAFKEVHDVAPGKAPRTVERHVFDVVRQSALRVGLEDGAGVDDQSEFRALFRLHVATDDVAKAVGQHAAVHGSVGGEGRGAGGDLGAGGERVKQGHE